MTKLLVVFRNFANSRIKTIGIATSEIRTKMSGGVHVKSHYSNPISITLESSRQCFGTYSCIKFHENFPVGAEMFHTDRHDETNSCF